MNFLKVKFRERQFKNYGCLTSKNLFLKKWRLLLSINCSK